MATKKPSLKEFIAAIGDEEFANRFNVKPRTARAYRLGERVPKRAVARRIVEGSSVPWEGIYGS